jgi:16S rRNA (cytosine967-C5)-methyltransferase
MRLRWVEVKAFLEALELSEKYKPFQVAKRRVMTKYGLQGSSLDRLATAVIYKMYRMQGLLDDIIREAAGVEPARLPAFLRQSLRLSVYLALYDETGDRELTEQLVAAASRIAARRFREGDAALLRSLYRRLASGSWRPSGEIRLEEELLLPPIIVEALLRLLGSMEEVREFARAVNNPRPVYGLRVNTLKASVEEVLEELHRLGVEAERSKRVPCHVRYRGGLPYDRLPLLLEGKAVPQDEASAAAAPLLSPRPGERVIDLCAAPGGKTTHIAQLQGNAGSIVALEIFPDRLARLEQLSRRTGTYRSIQPVLGDALNPPLLSGFDRALLDPPCSSTGAIARHPEARWRLTKETLKRLVARQYQMLHNAIRLLRPGGRLLYTVCSVMPEEGEELVRRVLEEEPVELIPLHGPYSSSPLLPGTMRAWPHRHGTTGFFYALLEKKHG